jgi:hypothetical protein
MHAVIPEALKHENEELHEELVWATKSGGRTGEAALAVAKLLHPHFVKEEAYALPPLGLLQPISRGEVTADMGSVLELTDKLEAEMPQMLAEHVEIKKGLEALVAAADAEGKPQYAAFAHKLSAHALSEEQLAYPAALLVGRYLKVVLPKRA